MVNVWGGECLGGERLTIIFADLKRKEDTKVSKIVTPDSGIFPLQNVFREIDHMML